MAAKYISLLVLISCFTTSVFAQKQNVYYLKNDQSRVSNKDSADYVRVVREPDSGSVFYNVLEVYKNGKRKLRGKSSKIEYNLLQQQCLEYYQNGNRKLLANYKGGKKTGKAFEFFPNGILYNVTTYPAVIDGNLPGQDDNEMNIETCNDSTGKALVVNGNGYYVGYHPNFSVYEEGAIKNGKRDSVWKGFADQEHEQSFIEKYQDGKLLSGNSADSAGTYAYSVRIIQPQYKNGEKDYAEYLSNNIVYPFKSKASNIEGLVMLSFIVEKNGRLSHVKFLKHVSDDIDAEAIRVISKSKNWVPGMRFGKPVRVLFTSPINFTLRD